MKDEEVFSDEEEKNEYHTLNKKMSPSKKSK